MKLRARAFGLAVGLVSGVGLFLATLLSLQVGKGQTLGMIGNFLPGYTVSFGGAFVGLLWGLVDGFVWGSVVAVLYNAIYKKLYK